jgi:histidine ammonia-lyase
MGEGEVVDSDGRISPASDALKAAGIEPVELREKEGLALINGTDGMLGMLIMAIADLTMLCDSVDVTAAMSVEALLGTDKVFLPELHEPLRPHPGQAFSAANMLKSLKDSAIVASHINDTSVVQDAYSLRCAPQVTGAVRDTIAHATLVATRELAAAVDNPVVLADGRVSSNGNFHGAPVAYVLDFLAIAAADLGSICERRTDRMLDKARSHGLPPFLADDPGVDSGLMIAQYTQAALVSENKRLAAPASVDSIPSSAMQEDHVSMGWSAGRKLRQVVENLTKIVGIEYLTAARAIDLRAPLQPSPITGKAVSELRKTSAGPGPDRFLAPDMQAAVDVVANGTLAKLVK